MGGTLKVHLLIILSRRLNRPNVNRKHVLIFSLILLALITDPIFLTLVSLELGTKIAVIILTYLLIIETYFRFYMIQIIKCYQHYAKTETRKRCVCIPSCSEYAIAVFKKYPLLICAYKIMKRLFVTCRGDYKIDNP